MGKKSYFAMFRLIVINIFSLSDDAEVMEYESRKNC